MAIKLKQSTKKNVRTFFALNQRNEESETILTHRVNKKVILSLKQAKMLYWLNIQPY